MSRCRFKPGLLPTLAALLLISIFITAGIWQWGRMLYKQELRDQRANNRNQPELQLTGQVPKGDLVGRKVVMQAEFSRYTLYLDNRKYHGEPGYFVFAVASIPGSRVGVLVNLGWTGQGADRQKLPVVNIHGGLQLVKGLINPMPAVGIRLVSPAMKNDIWPKRVQYIDVEWLQKKTGLNLLPFVILANTDTPPGKLKRDWRGIATGKMHMPPEKHLSYSVQWFALALAVVVVYLVVNIKKKA